jgi:hypothetical protein
MWAPSPRAITRSARLTVGMCACECQSLVSRVAAGGAVPTSVRLVVDAVAIASSSCVLRICQTGSFFVWLLLQMSRTWQADRHLVMMALAYVGVFVALGLGAVLGRDGRRRP